MTFDLLTSACGGCEAVFPVYIAKLARWAALILVTPTWDINSIIEEALSCHTTVELFIFITIFRFLTGVPFFAVHVVSNPLSLVKHGRDIASVGYVVGVDEKSTDCNDSQLRQHFRQILGSCLYLRIIKI